jgi:predicted PurR-regulated permease PerM
MRRIGMQKRSKKGSRRISHVNLSGSIVAIGLLGYALSLASPAELARTAHDQFAAASVSTTVGVPANPINSLAEQLKEKSAQLDVQQQHIQELQHSLSSGSNDTLGFYSFIASIFVLLLVVVNFYFDWRRGRGQGSTLLTRPFTVNLQSSPK